MLFGTNKERGQAGLSMAIAYFGSNGYTVSIPLNDCQDYDLIIDNGNGLKKVQVKSTGFEVVPGCYELSLKSSGGTKGKTYKTLVETDIDILFVFCVDGTMYLIPKEFIYQKTCMKLRKEKSPNDNTSKYDYSQFIVTI